KYMVESNHAIGNYLLITNTAFWNGLPAPVRTELEAIIEEVTQEVNRQAEGLNRQAREAIIAAGTSQLIVLTPEERNQWRQALQPVWKQYEPQIGKALIEAALAANRANELATHYPCMAPMKKPVLNDGLFHGAAARATAPGTYQTRSVPLRLAFSMSRARPMHSTARTMLAMAGQTRT